MHYFASLDTTPHRPSGSAIIGKTLIWLVVGVLLSLLLFLVLTVLGDGLAELTQDTTQILINNPLFPLVLLLVMSVITLLWSIAIALLYSAIFSSYYRDVGKWLRASLLSHGLLFVVLAPLYLLFRGDIDALFFVVEVHMLISFFVTFVYGDLLANPHYSVQHVLGGTLGLAVAIMVFAVILKTTQNSTLQDQLYIFLLFPSVISLTLLPLVQSMRQILYYGLYESGSDMLYVPSPSERQTMDEDSTDDALFIDDSL